MNRNKENKVKKIISNNKKAFYDYYIETKVEAGIILKGSEIKSIRDGNVSIKEAHIAIDDKHEIYIYNMNISEYKYANIFNHSPTRVRKMLMHKKEIKKMFGKSKLQGYTIAPLSLYINDSNIVKLEIGLAKGKKIFDKRKSIKEKEWKKEQGRIIRGYSK
ncbi:MAG TPA: SsrA-binding protein SmpB [Candidatus Megaira endosymbiont of Hartmannula sinica]|nr:SsrA-binding protein SmpB [Candidatus Megaera endosymbiont of Hartmannula sinica]